MESYSQTTEYTCAASSLLMVLHHFDKEYALTRENEFSIWQASANLPVRASSIYGLAAYAASKGLKPSIVLEEKEYDYPDYRFKGYTKKEIDEAKFSSRQHAKRARELGVEIQKREVTYEEVSTLLSQGKILLLRLNAGTFRDTKSTSKYMIVFMKEKDIVVMDPRRGETIIDGTTLQESMTTLQTKKKRDVRMIIFEQTKK